MPHNYDNHRLKSEKWAPNGTAVGSEVAQQAEDSEVVRRIKSPSPKEDAIDGQPQSPPLTKTEVKQLKQYNREPLINKSATIHIKRNTPYTEINLPESFSSTSSRSNSFASDTLYDVPRSNGNSAHYDTLPPTRPALPEHHPCESSKCHTPNTKRALPHLPTDYINIDPSTAGKFLPSDDLYAEIPDHIMNGTRPVSSVTSTPSSALRLVPSAGTISSRPGPLPPFRRIDSDPAIGTPLSMGGAKLFEELEEAGYEVFKAAPPIRGRLLTHSTSSEKSDEYMEVKEQSLPSPEDNQYIEVTRSKPRTKNGYEVVKHGVSQPIDTHEGSPGSTLKHHNYVNVPRGGISVPSTCEGLSTTPTSLDNEGSTTADSRTPDTSTDTVPDADSKNDSNLVGQHDSSNDVEQELVAINNGLIDEDIYIPMHSAGAVDEDTYLAMQGTSPVGVATEDTYVAMQKISSIDMFMKGDAELTALTASIDLHKSPSPQSLASSSPHSPPTLTSLPHPHTLDMTLPHPKNFTVPTAAGSPSMDKCAPLVRKRSSTLGDPLDTQEAKKHTYVNIPDEQITVPTRSKTVESPTNMDKPPMPLPKPERGFSLDETVGTNSSCNNNKVTTLIRQFSNTGRRENSASC